MATFELPLDKILEGLRGGLNELETGKAIRPALNYLGKKALRYTTLATPAKTGKLRRSWKAKVNVQNKSVDITNNVKYAEYVNDGHRIVRGGKTVGVAEPVHMLERTIMALAEYDLEVAQQMALDGVLEAISKKWS